MNSERTGAPAAPHRGPHPSAGTFSAASITTLAQRSHLGDISNAPGARARAAGADFAGLSQAPARPPTCCIPQVDVPRALAPSLLLFVEIGPFVRRRSSVTCSLRARKFPPSQSLPFPLPLSLPYPCLCIHIRRLRRRSRTHFHFLISVFLLSRRCSARPAAPLTAPPRRQEARASRSYIDSQLQFLMLVTARQERHEARAPPRAA
jgi:hypothetical protein